MALRLRIRRSERSGPHRAPPDAGTESDVGPEPDGGGARPDLEQARRLVSRAEQRALDRAELLRVEAEDLLRQASHQEIDAEVKVRGEVATELDALRTELEAAARRASVAESELDRLRADHAELLVRPGPPGADPAGPGEVPGPPPPSAGPGRPAPAAASSDPSAPASLRVLPGSEPDAGRPDPVDAAAVRLHAQAALELARARERAVHLLAQATREAEALLSSVMATVEEGVTPAPTSRRPQVEELRREAEELRLDAEDLRRSAQAALAEAAQEATRVREEALRDARMQADRILDQAHAEADWIVEHGRRDAAGALIGPRRQLMSEILGLRDAVERTRQSCDRFLGRAAGTRPGSLR